MPLTPATILPTSRPSDDAPLSCPCGWGRALDRQTHAARHLDWAYGLRVPRDLRSAGASVAVVTTAAPADWRHLAYRAARIAQRDGRYDFASFPRPYGRGTPDEHNTRALLYRDHDRILGYLVADEHRVQRRTNLRSNTDEQATPAYRTVVGLVFVAYHYRRAGIGRALIHAAADQASTTPDQLAWFAPFTDTGQALASQFTDDGGYVYFM